MRSQKIKNLFRACVVSLIVLSASAQSSGKMARFEVADVHPSPHLTSFDGRDLNGGLIRGGYHLRRATILDLVSLAYGTDRKKVLGGPSWLDLDHFDVRAKVPADTAAADVRPMLQALLAERFGLVLHRATKPVAAWELTSTNHSQLKQSDGPGAGSCVPGGSADLIDVTCRNMTMAAFVSNIGDMEGAWYYLTDNLVVDHTGLEGAWNFNLKYSRRWETTDAGAQVTSLFDAIDRIGLKMNPATVPLPVLVIDSVNRTPTSNSPEADKVFPPPPIEFEVAVVKPADPSYNGPELKIEDGGRVTVRSKTLRSAIEDAWNITSERIIGAPKFVDSDRWDIVAKAPDGTLADGDADIDSIRPMLKTLLVDRFKIAAHYEDRILPVYVITASKPKLKKADPASRSGCSEGPAKLAKVDPRSTNPVLGRLLTCTNVSMPWFAEEFSYTARGYIQGEVLDATGLEGGWDFTLSFSKGAQFRGGKAPEPGAAPDPNGAISAPEALEKQLGLKLELRKRPVRMLVIDRIEKTPTGN
ncbi:MAG TPA: TIGR03435 family protein [Bryobacteraceae bacterium]